jgi:hypothetical protein
MLNRATAGSIQGTMTPQFCQVGDGEVGVTDAERFEIAGNGYFRPAAVRRDIEGPMLIAILTGLVTSTALNLWSCRHLLCALEELERS